jgi:transposase
MRTYWRQRNDLVRSAGRRIQRIQKTLTQMNVQLANVLSDVSGMTGQAIIRAILAGERNPRKLAEFRDNRVKASEEQIARSLDGNWQEDLLFLLKQEQNGYEFCQKQIAECDGRLQQYLQQREDRSAGTSLPEEQRKERLRKKKENKPQFDLRAELFRMTGTDLTQIDGIDVSTAATVISEAGSKYPDVGGLCVQSNSCFISVNQVALNHLRKDVLSGFPIVISSPLFESTDDNLVH